MYRGRVSVRQDMAPPGFLRLAGHPLRWRLLSELARSDRQVRELKALLGQPQNLVSYHLARLRAGGLVAARRSSADGRDAYYSIDLARCGELLTAAGAALHPGLRLRPPRLRGRSGCGRACCSCAPGIAPARRWPRRSASRWPGKRSRRPARAAIPSRCTRTRSGRTRERGIDISSRQSRHLSVFDGEHFDYVITLCDRLREICPEFPGPAEVIHWSIPEPGAGTGAYPAFRAVAADLRIRIRFLLARISDVPEGPAGLFQPARG